MKLTTFENMVHSSVDANAVTIRSSRERHRTSRWAITVLAAALTSLDISRTLAVDDVRLSIAPGSESVAPQDIVTATLEVSGLSGAINGAQVLVHYDPNALQLISIEPNLDVGTGWTEAFEVDSSGDVTYVVTMLGGSASTDHTIATLTFDAIAEGITDLSFRPDALPLRTKLTWAADPTVIFPKTFGSESVLITCDNGLFCDGIETFDGSVCQVGTPPCDVDQCLEDTNQCLGPVPAVSEWGVVVMTLLFLTAGTVILHSHGQKSMG